MQRKNIICKFFLLAICILSVFGCSSQGPSDEAILKDWNNAFKKEKEENATIIGYKGCMDYIAFNGVEIVGKKIEGANAEVLIKVSGDWLIDHDPGFHGGACGGFVLENGKSQKVERRMLYEKLDTGWRLVEIKGVL